MDEGDEGATARDVVVPVVHQHVDRIERGDVVPPQGGDEDRVAWLQLGGLSLLQRAGEAGVGLEIGPQRVGHAHRLSGQGVVERADVEVAGGLGREQGEAPAPERHDGNIVRQVEVRGDFGLVAQPDARLRIALHGGMG